MFDEGTSGQFQYREGNTRIRRILTPIIGQRIGRMESGYNYLRTISVGDFGIRYSFQLLNSQAIAKCTSCRPTNGLFRKQLFM